ncbi:hypothetical protein [uncultured Bacteroides sp.]|jgi:hypothetical protein|uniref:hypothetical protein n=1 Tax=uncultured Bacteroides sp. TaxID=162156 RepID=UPI00258ADB62|nr:hypothetical protein [uncultured Bacteroides sp.]
MKHSFLFINIITSLFFLVGCQSKTYNDGFVQYEPIHVSDTDKQILLKYISEMDKLYNPEGKMITQVLEGWNYHTDAESGTFHDVRSSFRYAVALLDCGVKEYKQRALDVIEKTISLQDTVSKSRSCGVWPYFEEEPLATKKSPIDYNWADFNAVALLDIYMGHKDKLPAELLKKIENSIILAAHAIRKRNCGPSYTNIAIMGTYITYVTSHLFNIPEMQDYAKKRLKTFYDYTQEKNGFSEYNSPTYSIVAIDELNRMQRHIIEPEAKKMIDELYEKCWDMIARHYHQKTAQWAGPHSRSYSTLIDSSFYGILKEASQGKVALDYEPTRSDIKIKHYIPERLLPYFLTPEYPRTEVDVFEKKEPQVIGTTYLTDDYVISSVSRSSMWNQRRPLTAYWGELNATHYLQVRMLHDNYDFSTASIFTQQKENQVLAAINFATNGGDKHLSIDRIRNGKFKANDLRLRFEFGNCKEIQAELPTQKGETFTVLADGAQMTVRLLEACFDNLKGYWEKGGDGKNSWVDYVIYSGEEKEFDLTRTSQAIYAFALSLNDTSNKYPADAAIAVVSGNSLHATWGELSVQASVKPNKNPQNL